MRTSASTSALLPISKKCTPNANAWYIACMPLLTSADRSLAEAVSGLVCCNPFVGERITFERAALGDRAEREEPVWSLQPDRRVERPNVQLLRRLVTEWVGRVRPQLGSPDATPTAHELQLYEDVVFYHLYDQHLGVWQPFGQSGDDTAEVVKRYTAFEKEADALIHIPGVRLPGAYTVPHLFALFFQIRRAFKAIFLSVVGTSRPIAALRRDIWQSIFTHDLRRYARSMFSRMNDVSTLITGPSGTGKELVARAIAWARYLPFDPKTRQFGGEWQGSFYALNLAAFSPTLVESELFGHRRGAFTGAAADRAGWLESAGRYGTVFLDEVGEVEPAIQVKLLRVLQTRQFERVGDTAPRRFDGRLLAATNRDLAIESSAGRFRRDFFYRICTDVLTTPPLASQLADAPDDLPRLVRFIADTLLPEEAQTLTLNVADYVRRELGPAYAWPGNFRELEQCVRSYILRGSYRPLLANGPAGRPTHATPSGDSVLARNGRNDASDANTASDADVVPAGNVNTAAAAANDAANAAGPDALIEALSRQDLPANDLMRRYARAVYARTGSYESAAAVLGLDRRTAKAKIGKLAQRPGATQALEQ